MTSLNLQFDKFIPKSKASPAQLKSLEHLSKLEFHNLGDPFKVHCNTNFENLSCERFHKELTDINIRTEVNKVQVEQICAEQERDPTFQNRDVYSGKLKIIDEEWGSKVFGSIINGELRQ